MEEGGGGRARFLAYAQHELNTPLAILRGWVETLDEMWDDLSEVERRRGVSASRRSLAELTALVEAVLADVRADTLARDVPTGRCDVAPALAALSGRHGLDALAIDVEPGLVADLDRTVLETLALQIGAGVAACGAPVLLTARRADGGIFLEARGPAEGPADPFDAFPDGRPSLPGLRWRSARQLARALGGDVEVATDQGEVVVRAVL